MGLLTLLRVTILTLVVFSEGSGSKCQTKLGFAVSIDSTKNSNGEWVTAFTAIRNTSDPPLNAGLDLNQVVTDCDGNHMIKINGIMKDVGVKKQERLTFYPKTGTNAAITNNGRTAMKLRMDEALDGVVFTSRPLRDDEIFEVKLEKKGSKFSNSMGIGVTTHSPEKYDILAHMNREKTGTWMYYGVNAWNNGTKAIASYGTNIYSLQVGETVGVMRSKYGALHYFANGIDQGPAATNMPQTLYGVFELYGDAGQISIIEPTSL